MSDHCSTYFQGLWPDGRLILDVTLNEMVILQWFHQDFVLSSASREVTVTRNSYIFLKTKSRQFPCVPAWISKAQCSKHGQNPIRCVFDWSVRKAIRPWEYSNSFFWWNRFNQIWAPKLQSIVQMWRLPCLISIESTNHEMTSSALRPIHVKDFFVSSHHADDQTFTRVHPFQDDLGPAASVAAQIQDHGLPGWIWIASLGNLLLETQWILRICHKKNSQEFSSPLVLWNFVAFFWHLSVARISAFHGCKVGLVRMENRTSSCFSLNAARDLWHCSGTLREEKHPVQYKKS